jgi:hypothetical protein
MNKAKKLSKRAEKQIQEIAELARRIQSRHERAALIVILRSLVYGRLNKSADRWSYARLMKGC